MVKEITTKAFACERSMLCYRRFPVQGGSTRDRISAANLAERHERLDSEHVITCQDPSSHRSTILLVGTDQEPLRVLSGGFIVLSEARERALELARQLREAERQKKPSLPQIGDDFQILDIGTYWGIPKH